MTEFQNKKFQEKMTINYSISSILLSHQLNKGLVHYGPGLGSGSPGQGKIVMIL